MHSSPLVIKLSLYLTWEVAHGKDKQRLEALFTMINVTGIVANNYYYSLIVLGLDETMVKDC